MSLSEKAEWLGEEPAYPQTVDSWFRADQGGRGPAPSGLTKRELFTGMAMQGILAGNREQAATDGHGDCACRAISLADRLLEALAEAQRSDGDGR